MTMTEPTTADAAFETYLNEHADERLESYKELIRIPSISALSEHAADCRRTAEWIVEDLTRIGMEHAEASETGGHPIVYADWLHAPGRPTVLVYCHYDVQPVDPLDLWTSPPFEPIVDGHRILGRGVSDDKGQLHAHLRAIEALLATRDELPVNLKICFEGEEESSSLHLDDWLTANRERLAADFALISDTGFFTGNIPSITIALRGLVYIQVDVIGTKLDLHSGGYGGTVENPANALARIIAALKDDEGRILVPGFYDDVVELGADERRSIADLPFDEDAYLGRLGLPELHGEAGYSTLERRGARPTLDVNGIWGGFQGEGSKTIIPAHAHAKISCRLVANQDPVKISQALRDFVVAVAPKGVRVETQELGHGMPLHTPVDHPATQAAARALEATFGRAPVYVREGGSIPICASFQRILGQSVVLMGFVPPEDGAHAPNEWNDLRNYETSIRAIARMWDEIAGLEPELLRV
ncbi:MAG TPA: dipeptidase [Candidatus Limnocylindrales bacterium]|nr:dipeptidase [Candidatus Limnocylindrales bacterium]